MRISGKMIMDKIERLLKDGYSFNRGKAFCYRDEKSEFIVQSHVEIQDIKITLHHDRNADIKVVDVYVYDIYIDTLSDSDKMEVKQFLLGNSNSKTDIDVINYLNS